MKLIDIFDEIDVNGDGDMEWDEFTLYCIEDAMAATRREGAKVPKMRVRPPFQCQCLREVVPLTL